ncbi:MAG: AMP-binding protein [Clostridia bacterium]|nr:AMP-binding protein [Clostridia bacterium]
MKIAFSTLGCPEWSWNEIYPMAKDLGFDGIEIRGLGNEIHAARTQPFADAELDRTMAELRSLGLDVACFSSACCVKNQEYVEATLAEGMETIDLAARTGVPFVRILADREPHAEGDVDDAAVARVLKRLADHAAAAGVTLLVETNGVYAESSRMRSLLDRLSHPAVKVLWDVHHPIRFFGESPAYTYSVLGRDIAYVHVKDSIREADGTVRYRMMGEGDLGVDAALDVLVGAGYSGYVSLEWVKRWSGDLEDAAVVFPHFVNYMDRFLAGRGIPRTSETRRGTAPARPPVPVVPAEGPFPAGRGQRIWEKDILVEVTLHGLIRKVADLFPDQAAVAYVTQDYRRTYSGFRDEIDRVARGFLAMGIRKGDHIAVWSTNHPQWLLTFFAAARIGGVLVTVNTSYKIHELEYQLRQCDAHTLVMMDAYKDSDYVAILREICPELETSVPGALHAKRLPVLRNVVNFSSKQSGCYSWEDVLTKADDIPESRLDEIEATLSPHDVVNMQYTSGTTGFPKGVMLTHYNIINNGKCIGDCMDFSTADKLLIPVPFFHCFGMVLAILAAVTHGTTMVPLEYFQPVNVLRAIREERCTAMHGVPTMFIATLEHPDFANTDFSTMRTGIMAGSPCPVKVMQEVVDRMHMSEITIVFGQTESSPGCTQSRVDDPLEARVATVGRELPGVTCRIVDPATNLPVPDGTPGEFVAKGYNIMKGYYKMPEATAAAIDSDGWLHTGDLAVRDGNGNYKITGRIKDMIIRGGENIYPKEIEEFLYTHSAVKDVQVVGVPDKVYGEAVLAAVILREGAAVGEEELKAFVREHMAKHKTPKHIVFVTEFPMTASGKIQKFKIREWAIEHLHLQEAASIETA